ncbi:hypothetical protein D3C77_518700 [compost metagenome]
MALVGVAVTNVQVLEMKAFESTSDIQVVVDADHHLALAAPHKLSHALVVLEGEIASIPSGTL